MALVAVVASVAAAPAEVGRRKNNKSDDIPKFLLSKRIYIIIVI